MSFKESNAFAKAFTREDLDNLGKEMSSYKYYHIKTYIVVKEELLNAILKICEVTDLEDGYKRTLYGVDVIKKDPLYEFLDHSDYIMMDYYEYEQYCTIVENMRKLIGKDWLYFQ